jgi:Cof subfamily protein (haloacid dehalogenase superfamily)
VTPKPRAVVTDLDGTVVRWNGTVTAATAAAALALRRGGVPLVTATARTSGGLAILGPVLDHVTIAVCGNGAVGLRPGPPRETLWRQGIPEPVARQIIEVIARELPEAAPRAHDGTQWTITPNYATVRGTLPTSSPVRVAPIADLIGGEVLTICVCHPELDSAQIVAILSAAGVDRSIATMSFGSSDIMDISAAGVDKAFGVRKALACLGIDPADAVAFGDADNDLPMFAAVGTSVAMGNASPPVLAAATRVTASVDDDGFAKALAELGLIV